MSIIYKISINNEGSSENVEISEDSFYIGRSGNANLTIKNDQLSRKHLHVKLHENTIYIMDLNTTNGTFLNNRKIKPSQWVSLIELDTIGFGHSEITIQIIHEIIKTENVVKLKPKEFTLERPSLIQTSQAAPEVKTFDSAEYEKLEKLRVKSQIEVHSLKLKNTATLEAKKIITEAKEKVNLLISESNQLLEHNESKLQELIIEQTECSNEVKDLLVQKHKSISEVECLKLNLASTLEEHNSEVKRLKALKQEADSQSVRLESQVEESEAKIVELNDEYLTLLEKNDDITLKMVETQKKFDLVDTEFVKLRDREAGLYLKVEELNNTIDQLYQKKSKLLESNSEIEERILIFKSDESILLQRIDDLESEFRLKSDAQETRLLEIEESRMSEFDSLIEDARKESSEIIKTARSESELILKNSEEKIITNNREAQELTNSMIEEANEILSKAQVKLAEAKEFELTSLKNLELKEHDLESSLHELSINSQKTIEDNINACNQDIALRKDEAIATAKTIIEEAQTESSKMILDAQNNIVSMQDNANSLLLTEKHKLQSVIDKLDAEVKEMKCEKVELSEKIKILHDDHEGEKIKLLAEIQEQKDILLEQARLESVELLDQANSKSGELVDQAICEAKNLVDNAKNESIELLDNARAEAFELSRNEEELLNAKREEERELLAKLRAQEVDSLKLLRDKTQVELDTSKVQHVSLLTSGLVTSANELLKEKGLSVKIENSEFEKIVKAVVSGDSPENSALLKKLNPYGAGGGNSTRMMKRLSRICGAIVFLWLVHLGFPQLFNGITSTIKQSFEIETSAQDLYKKDIEDKRKSAPKFSPKLNSTFKESYVDNIINTTNFSGIWLSDEFQKQWTIKIDEVLVYRFKLSDYKVIKYISLEFKLVRDLQELRDKITLKNKNEILKEMRELEAVALSNIENLVEGEENLENLLLIQQGFYTDYLK